MAIADADISINTAGDIRWTGQATTNRHSVLEFIQWLMAKQDDEQAAGDDILDITVDTPFERSTDQILSLNTPFNIDDTFALHLFDGSVSQNGGDDLYSGLNIIGPVEADTEYEILQGGKLLPAFWGIGINPEDSPSLVFSRHLVKSREGGADIDGKRITVLARELGDQFRRFPVTLGTGNSVAAIGNGLDIFNTETDSNLAAISNITNTEGWQEINIDGSGASGQEFYSQWVKDSNSTNDVYEFTKWMCQRAACNPSDSAVETGDDFVIDNTTITGIGQEFQAPATDEMLVGAKLSIKIGGGNLEDFVGVVYAELYDSDEAGDPAPTGSALARSENILASQFTDTYEDTLFQFNWRDPSDGSDQRTGLTLTAGDPYFIVIQHPLGTATEYLYVQGDTTAGVGFAKYEGSWGGVANDGLGFETFTAPIIHGISADRFEGINVEVGYSGESGAGVPEDDIAFWGTKITYGTLSGGPFFPGEQVRITTGGVSGAVISGGMVLYDDASDELVIALDTLNVSYDAADYILGLTSGANALWVSDVDNDLSGGEGIVLAKDDGGATGEFYLQVISGSNPVSTNVIRSQTTPLANYADATSTINTRTVIPEFLGTSTGSNIIGTYGIGFDKDDVGSSDLLRALDNLGKTPPNNVQFKVIGLVSGQDRVLVGPRSGSDELDRGQWLLATALSGAAETEIVVKSGNDTVPFPNTKTTGPYEINWPDTGLAAEPSKLRVQLNNGIYKHIDYDSHDGIDTFDITGSAAAMRKFDVDGADADKNVFMAFIDKEAEADNESFTGVHDTTDRDLFVRVRDGGGTPIKTYESITAQFLSTAQTIAATRTADA